MHEDSSDSRGESDAQSPAPANYGPPRWLLIGFALKFVLVLLITLGVVWWTAS